jgi:hypothetical protein
MGYSLASHPALCHTARAIANRYNVGCLKMLMTKSEETNHESCGFVKEASQFEPLEH